jgi:hypothetical protein
MKLYWATTRYGLENWFVVAGTIKAAARFHEESEGFNEGDAKAHFVCDISEKIAKEEKIKRKPCWPTLTLLKKLGAKVITAQNPRRINFDGKVYSEGGSVQDLLISDTGDEAGLYVVNIQGTSKYKIGITTNLKRRLKPLKTSNPENLKLIYFVRTLHIRSLEKFIHLQYKKHCIGGEWFSLNSRILKDLENQLRFICVSRSDFTFNDGRAVLKQARFL